MKWKQAPWMVIDTETTGVDDTAKIVELGSVLMCAESCDSPRRVVRQRRGMLLNPGKPIPAESTEVHGIRDEDVADAPTIEEIADRFLAAVAPAAVLVGYNFAFDSRILSREIGPKWDQLVRDRIVIDPLVIVRMDHVGRYWSGKGRHKLGAVAERLGVEAERGHRATADCVTTCRVLEKLLKYLPDDGAGATAWVAAERAKQDEAFAAWKAANPQDAA